MSHIDAIMPYNIAHFIRWLNGECMEVVDQENAFKK